MIHQSYKKFPDNIFQLNPLKWIKKIIFKKKLLIEESWKIDHLHVPLYFKLWTLVLLQKCLSFILIQSHCPTKYIHRSI